MGASSVALSIAVLVGWVVVIAQNSVLTRQVTQHSWLLFAGAFSLLLIISVLVLFSVFLVRETLETRRQDSFIDSVTHELKSPLASIKLCLETLARPEVQGSQREELRRMMLKDVERLSVFIDDVIESSRLVHGRRTHNVTDVHLHSVLEHCAEMIRWRYTMPLDCITWDIPQDLWLRTDKTALETIIKNLLDNAVKYSDPPVHVQVRILYSPKRELGIEVADDGIGIPQLQIKRIFERFYRVADPAVRARRGTGLGLFVVAALVRMLGGRFEAYSGGPGRGSTMRVFLPHTSLVPDPTQR